MGSSSVAKKPHVVCIPYPAQGHLHPMLKLAKFLHHKGFHITFVNTEFNHRRLLKSRGTDSLNDLPDFRFETIPDGLPPSDIDATQDIPALCESLTSTCIVPFRALLAKLINDSTKSESFPVTCILSDSCMPFTLQAAQEVGIPLVSFWTISACATMCCLHFQYLVKHGFIPVKDETYLTNGYFDTPINSVPGLNDIRLRDFPSFIRITDTNDVNDIMFKFTVLAAETAVKASALVFNTFHAFEAEVLDSMESLLSLPIYTIGPLQLLPQQIEDDKTKQLRSNLWKEDEACIKWLDSKQPGSVVYVNFGSITIMTTQQLIEFAWGLANSKHPFLWIIRPDLVNGEMAVLPSEFTENTKERSLISSWCPQEQILRHPSVGGFLTHSGWNSTLDTICGGVPVISWPFFADQQTNCRSSCKHWGIGMEMDNTVKRDEVESLVRELMEGEKGKEMKKRAMQWKESAEESMKPDGTSFVNLEKLVKERLLSFST